MITFSQLGSFGQLANQMFQYAMLLGVAAKNNFEVKIPKRFTGEKKKDQVELFPFSITTPELTQQDRIENNFTYDNLIFNEQVFQQPDGTDFRGYFQSEKYFEHIQDVIRKEFSFQFPYLAYAQQYIKNIRGPYKIVAIHVRRGDYLNTPNIFWELPVRYYLDGIDFLPSIPKKYLIFSDDISWCKTHFGSFSCHYVETDSYIHDLAIMSLCDYFIISPSSFSWWAAWLSTAAEDKTIVAPDPWFVPGCRFKGKDIVPENWIKCSTLPYLSSQKKKIDVKRRGKVRR